MMLMKNMDVTSFPKDQRKLIKKIAVMTPYEIIKDISTFYDCPAECNAQCCKNFDIPLNPDDKIRISKHGIGYRKIIKEQVKTQQSIVGEDVFVEDVFTSRPCPFLKNNRCSIHKFNPLLCSIYPFKVTKLAKSMLEIVACPMGADILIDFSGFELVMAMVSKERQGEAPTKLADAVECARSIVENGCKSPETSLVYGIENLETLRYFLLYLHNEDAKGLLAKRVKLIEMAMQQDVPKNE